MTATKSLFAIYFARLTPDKGNRVPLGEIASLCAIMSLTDMPVLNYDVIYDMCEPQVKSSGVSYLCTWSTEFTDDAR